MKFSFDPHSMRPAGLFRVAVIGVMTTVTAFAQVRQQNGVAAYTQPNDARAEAVDYINAKPLDLPVNRSPIDPIQLQVTALLTARAAGESGMSPGAQGSGALSPVYVGAPAVTAGGGGVDGQMYGTKNHPFSTSRADLDGGGATPTNTRYPYRAAGKLFFKIGTSTYICSASLIKRGVVVTAAHCVANFGKSQFYTGWQFIPGFRNGVAPYGTWTVKTAYVMNSYFTGTEACAQFGVICPNDVAVLVLNTQNNAYPGTSTGWYGYGYGGYGYANNQTLITQIGYPAGLDNALYMERNDSSGFVSASQSNNTVIGSNMDGGSSGGPWVVNFGIAPVLTGETNGTAPGMDVVVGVTSWGYTSTAAKEQGASPFTSGNIQTLVTTVCGATPGACN